MINIVIDLSNMFHRSMFIVGGYGSKGFTFNSQAEIDKLIRKVATDISYILRQTSSNRVIFAVDSKSWRKKVEIVENEGYKGNRTKSEHLNWDNIYQAMNEFCSLMNKKGLITTKIEEAEADDIMCLWRDKLLFEKNQHVIIVSGDEDIRQLVSYYPYAPGKMAHAVIFNPFTQGKNAKKKLYVSEKYFNEWISSDIDDVGDIFNRSADPEKEAFVSLLNDDQVRVEEVEGSEIALRKIFCGDEGDNIPAFYTWMSKTKTGDPVQKRLTPSTYSKLMGHLKPINLEVNKSTKMDHFDLYSLEMDIYRKITEIAGHHPDIDIKERLDRQIKLTVLSREVFPKEIVDEFESIAEKELEKVPDMINGWYMNSLLEGSRYIDETYMRSKNEASIFKEIDRISQQLF